MIVALTIHEAAHAWTADRLGDPTARLLGRVSLNPLVHIDPIGTHPAAAGRDGQRAADHRLGEAGAGQHQPAAHQRRDFMIVAAAGPISNFLQAWSSRSCPGAFTNAGRGRFPAILWKAVETNLLLAFFNLIPIPPLDGGNVLAGLARRGARVLDQVRQLGFIALYALMLTGILHR